jgi:hypothetical protein
MGYSLAMIWRPRFYGGLLIAVILSLLSSSHCQETSPLHLTPPSVPVPASYFGVHLHAFTPQSWPQIPSSELRLWDTKGTIWYTLEPRRGQWNFNQLDQDLNMAEQHHTGLLLTLGQTPPWASPRPNDPPSYRPGATAPPSDEEDWKTYVQTVAVRYQGRIRAYEIWNEPNLKEFYSGTREQLFALAKDAYQIIHETDPTAVVVSPSITGAYDIGWLGHYLDLGGGKYADVIGYHFYSSPHPPEVEVSVIQQVRAVMRSHGIDKPLWDTESGYLIKSDLESFAPEKGTLSRILTPEESVAYVMRAYILNWAYGVSRFYWYDWDGNRMGLGDNSGKQKKPAAYAYTTIQQWLVGAVVQSCDSDSEENWTCELSRNKRREWIVWNAEKSGTKTIPESWTARRFTTLSSNGSAVTDKVPASRLITFSQIPTLLQ